MSIKTLFAERYTAQKPQDMSVQEYLDLCKKDPMAYASSAERMLAAIGTPTMVDTSQDPRMSRIFNNRRIAVYETFKEFYGMETAIEQIVAYFKHAAQGLEESRQILYLLGPVGGGKSSLAEHLKKLMQVHPMYVLCYKADSSSAVEVSPYFSSPLALFPKDTYGEVMLSEYGISHRYLKHVPGPWLSKRLIEANGDLSRFVVRKMYPSIINQEGITKTEPGDENNQDISSLVGKVDIRKLKLFPQNDADAYSFSGGLCRANQGLMEFVEMFKAPIKVLHPLLTATQEGNFNGTEAIPAIPFSGTVLAHSNESEWETFRTNKNNEAFIDRVYIVKVPYCLRYTEEMSIYKKLLNSSDLSNATCAPYTLKMLAQFMVMTRLTPHSSSSLFTKLRVYDGENLKDTDSSAKPFDEYRSDAGLNEGMNGWSTRTAFKILAKVFNFDPEEQAANPVHLMYVLETEIEKAGFNEQETSALKDILKSHLQGEYQNIIQKEIQAAYLESYSDYGQNLFERYVLYADHYIQEQDYRDPETGQQWNRAALDEELRKMEIPANIHNARDFRNEIVTYVLRYKGNNAGKMIKWNAYEKIKQVIEARMFSSTEELLPIISFTKKSSTEDTNKHREFVERMCKSGYTEKQVRLLVEWYLRVSKSS